MDKSVQWLTASPMWAEATTATDSGAWARFRQPAILRFASDSFMDELAALLAADPAQLPGLRAMPENWRDSMPVTETIHPLLQIARGKDGKRNALGLRLPPPLPKHLLQVEKLPRLPGQAPLKLFQAAHQRFYLAMACLVCGMPGLPDRVIDASQQEQVSFVVRRLIKGKEHAWVEQARARVWQTAGDAQHLVEGEEQLPLFPVNFIEGGRRRRLLAALVPVGKREAYHGSSIISNAAPAPFQDNPPPDDLRMALLTVQVLEPWKRLIDRAKLAQATINPIPETNPNIVSIPADKQAQALDAARENFQAVSWLILLDLSRFLKTHLTTVTAETESVHNALDGIAPAADTRYGTKQLASSLSIALKQIESWASIENTSVPYRRKSPEDEAWPSFLFPLADPSQIPADPSEGVRQAAADALKLKVSALGRHIEAALKKQAMKAAPAPPASMLRGVDGGEASFVIRFVFERPACGPLQPALVSEPTDAFQMASFFDPDAPVRPVRVTLPVDTTPAGLRKFAKGASFAVSDVLCGQIESAGSLTLGDLVRSVLPWPLHKDLDIKTDPCKHDGMQAGMVCSLSIPIVTLCAFILLIIIVSLLDFIFRWSAFFILCFPLPGLKAKNT